VLYCDRRAELRSSTAAAVLCYDAAVIYEWDPAKAASNLRQHRVSFAEATSVFLDPVALTFDDPDHSDEEDREITIGTSSKQRVLFVSHCARGDRIRVISARKATRRERKQYAEGIGGGG
jgi:uncharacterized protein